MKNKVLKIVLSVLIVAFLLSLSVLPCFAYGSERDSFNVVLNPYAYPTSINWDVTLQIEGLSYYDDPLSTSVNFKFDPVLPFTDLNNVLNSYTTESAESVIPMPNAGYNELLKVDLYRSYDFNNDSLGVVDVVYEWDLNGYESNWDIVGIQYQARQFYYTYDPSIEGVTDGVSPFDFTFEGASSVTTMVYYHELGNAVDVYSVSVTDDVYSQSLFQPSLFGYSDDEAFTLFIDSVVVIPHYDSLSTSDGGFDMSYVYDPAFCQFSRASDLNSHLSPPSDAAFADYSSWIGLAVSGFLEFQIFPGFSFGALFMVIVSFSTVMWFLKLFAGG